MSSQTHSVTVAVGAAVGDSVGELLGDSVGEPDGEAVGESEGDAVGESVGELVGGSVTMTTGQASHVTGQLSNTFPPSFKFLLQSLLFLAQLQGFMPLTPITLNFPPTSSQVSSLFGDSVGGSVTISSSGQASHVSGQISNTFPPPCKFLLHLLPIAAQLQVFWPGTPFTLKLPVVSMHPSCRFLCWTTAASNFCNRPRRPSLHSQMPTTSVRVGLNVGDTVGDDVGNSVGDSVGELLGELVGDSLGEAVGDSLGEPDGEAVGEPDGEAVGDSVGDSVGDDVGDDVGEPVGGSVTMTTGQVSHVTGHTSQTLPPPFSFCLHHFFVFFPAHLQVLSPFFFVVKSPVASAQSAFLPPPPGSTTLVCSNSPPVRARCCCCCCSLPPPKLLVVLPPRS